MVTPGNRFGYLLLSLGVVVGLFFSYQTDHKLEKFVERQCTVDKVKDKAIVGALEDAKRRAFASLVGRPDELEKAVNAIQRSIDQIKQAPDCKV